jgi:hypothetical protein
LKRTKSQALLLEFFAYYYSDNEFERVTDLFFNDASEVIKNKDVNVFHYILNAWPEIEYIRQLESEPRADFILSHPVMA